MVLFNKLKYLKKIFNIQWQDKDYFVISLLKIITKIRILIMNATRQANSKQ